MCCDPSDQRINFQKSEIFVSPNMLAKDKPIVREILGIAIVDSPGIYLGSAMDFKIKKVTYLQVFMIE